MGISQELHSMFMSPVDCSDVPPTLVQRPRVPQSPHPHPATSRHLFPPCVCLGWHIFQSYLWAQLGVAINVVMYVMTVDGDSKSRTCAWGEKYLTDTWGSASPSSAPSAQEPNVAGSRLPVAEKILLSFQQWTVLYPSENVIDLS